MPILPLQNPPRPDGTFEISEEDRRHWIKVRRVKPGNVIEVLLPDGTRAEAEIFENQGLWLGKIQKVLESSASASLPCHLGVGMVRWPRMEWLVEKSAELALAQMTPLFCRRGRFSPEETPSANKLQRLEKIARETQKQSENSMESAIHAPASLDDWLKEIKERPGRKIFLDETAAEPRLTSDFLLPPAPEYFFIVGPEGGFDPDEREEILQSGFQPVSLGEKKLKTETAALYALIVLDTALIFP